MNHFLYRYSYLFALLLITACEPVTSEIADAQEDIEAQRRRLSKAKVRMLEVFSLNAEGDTLAQRAFFSFNEHGERVLWRQEGLPEGTREVKYTYTPSHQVLTEKHYLAGELLVNFQYEYGVSAKPVAAIGQSTAEEIKKQWTYDKEGRLQTLTEEVWDKVADKGLKYSLRTVYVYEAEQCMRKEEQQLDAQGKELEKISYQYNYNGRGRKIREQELISEQLVSERYWEYSQDGQVKHMAYYVVDGTGSKIVSYQQKYRYDKDGLCVQITTGNGAGNILEQQFYVYQYLK